ncbi:hypothetical protein [Saccharibacillus kuerlensis]|uniref:Secreted protein n=1 Tax=Saccharibacillus kuerlensis TaxID=459527 RepID=A0ABQ2KUJ0_9BACL|nr:hypothetical protein [Saccharibacillus kuerlensis]GGN93629.1 hypothetical protein GCM10010969_07590 [Saccharibacillus kuerlensis]
MQKKNSLTSLFVVLSQLPLALSGIVHSEMRNGISLSKFEPSTLKFANGITLSKIRNKQRNAAPVSHLRIGPALFVRPHSYPQP